MAATYDAFLVLRSFRRHVSEFQLLMAPLAHLDRSYLDGADGFYSDELDTALVALHFHAEIFARLGHDGIRELVDSTGLPVIIPSTIELEARQRFANEHLPRYPTYVQLYPHDCETAPLVDRVVQALAEHFGPGSSAARHAFFELDGELPLPLPGAARRITPRGGQPAARPMPRAITS